MGELIVKITLLHMRGGRIIFFSYRESQTHRATFVQISI